MHITQPRLVLWALLLPVSLLVAEGERYWERFPPLPRSHGVVAMGVGGDGVLWVTGNDGSYVWDAGQKVWVAKQGMGSSRCRYHLAPTGELFATRLNPDEVTMYTHRLVGGEAEPVPSIWGTGSSRNWCFEVCRDGRLFHWRNGRYAVYTGGTWQEGEARGISVDGSFLDLGDTLSLLSGTKLFVLEKGGGLRTVDMAGVLSAEPATVARWGENRAIARASNSVELVAFSAATGERVDLASVNQVLAGHSVLRLFSLPGGSVGVLSGVPGTALHLLWSIAPDGETQPLCETLGVVGYDRNLAWSSETVAADAAGRIWFANGDRGVFCLDNGLVRQFAPRIDGSPAKVTALAVDPAGVIYALANWQLYAYNCGTPLTDQPRPAPRPCGSLGEPVWSTTLGNGLASKVVRIGNRVELAVLNPDTSLWGMVGIDLRTGEGCLALRQTKEDQLRPACAGSVADQWVLARGRSGEVIDVTSRRRLRKMEVVETIERTAPRDPNGRGLFWLPLLALPDGGCVFAHSRGMLCLDATGKPVWERAMAGGIPRSLPVVVGNRLGFQADSKQAQGVTCWLDLDSGEPVWAQLTSYSGTGITLAPDGDHLLESGHNGTVTCRRLQDGIETWQYRQPHSSLSLPPVVDAATNRVYVRLDDAVVALDTGTGALAWKTALPHPPFRLDTAYWWGSCQNGLALSSGVLLLTDQSETLALLDAETGRELARFPLAEDVIRFGKCIEDVGILSPPWLVGDSLVVARSTGVQAYRFPVQAYLPSDCRPSLTWSEPPPEQLDSADVSLAIKAAGAGALTMRYRVDGQAWQKEALTVPIHQIRLRELRRGAHRAQIVVFDEAGRSSPELACLFRVVSPGLSEAEEVAARTKPPEPDAEQRSQAAVLALGGDVGPFLTRNPPVTGQEPRHDLVALFPTESSEQAGDAGDSVATQGLPDAVGLAKPVPLGPEAAKPQMQVLGSGGSVPKQGGIPAREAVTPALPEPDVAGLVAQLGAVAFADREAAKQALLKLGKAVIPYLQTVRDSPDPEIRLQVREILKALEE